MGHFIYSIKMKCVLILAALFLSTEAGNLPSYLSQCCVTDPDAEKCYLEQAKLVVPLVLSGDKHYNVMSLLPYREAQRTLLNNDYGKFILHTLRLWGLDTIQVLQVKLHIDKGLGTSQYHFHRLRLQFTYNINILDTPLVGFGRGEIILDDVNLAHSIKFVVDKENYIFITDASATFTASNIAYNLENLSVEAQEYLQENYDQLHELFEPNLRRLFSIVIASPLRSYAEIIKLNCAIGIGKDCKKC